MGKKCLWANCGEDVSSSDVQSHINNHIEEIKKSAQGLRCRWLNCQYEKSLSSISNLIVHFKNHFSPIEFKCQYCFNLMATEESLKKHVLGHEVENEKIARTADGVFIDSELRDDELDRTHHLLVEREYYYNLAKILKDEIVRDKTNDDTWNDYL